MSGGLSLWPRMAGRGGSHTSRAQHGPAVAAAQACGVTTCLWQARDTG